MTREDWRRLKPLLEAALDLDPAAQSDYVASVSADDAALGEELSALLAGSARAEFLDGWQVGRVPVAPAVVAAPEVAASGRVTEVRLSDLEPYARLEVSTRHGRYDVLLVSPLTYEVVVTGGRRFPEPTAAVMRTEDTIRVGRQLALRVGTRMITTTAVTQIDILPAPRAARPPGPAPD